MSPNRKLRRLRNIPECESDLSETESVSDDSEYELEESSSSEFEDNSEEESENSEEDDDELFFDQDTGKLIILLEINKIFGGKFVMSFGVVFFQRIK